LLTEDESSFALENNEMFIIVPVINYNPSEDVLLKKYKGAQKCKIGNYTTEDKKYLSVEQIKKMLVKDDKKMFETLNFYC